MSNFLRQALIAQLIREMRAHESWCGRTHIHKTLYAFQQFFQPETGLRVPFTLYMYGPYSFPLDEELTQMEFFGTIARREFTNYGPRYNVTDSAGWLEKHYGPQLLGSKGHIAFVADRIAPKNVRELEALATVIYVYTDPAASAFQFTDEERRATVQQWKPHLSSAELDQAFHEYQILSASARNLNGSTSAE